MAGQSHRSESGPEEAAPVVEQAPQEEEGSQSNSERAEAMQSSGSAGPPGSSDEPSEGAWGRGGPGGASVLEPLFSAVRSAVVADADTAFAALNRSGRNELRTHPILREYVDLIPSADGLARLRTVRPSKQLWLDIADDVFGANADLTQALQDNRITDGRKLVSSVATISLFPNMRASAVLQPILDAAQDKRNHGPVLKNPTAVGLVQGGGATFTVLPGLDEASTRAAYGSVEAARSWLNGDLVTLGTKISGWGGAAALGWTQLLIEMGNVAQVETWYDADVAAWQPLLQGIATLRRVPADIKSTFVPGQSLAVKVIDAAAATSTVTAANLCKKLGWEPTEGFERAIAAPWLDAEGAAALAGRDTAMNEMLATTATIQAGLATAGVYIVDAFPRLREASIERLYHANAGFKTAIESDAARFAELQAQIPSLAAPVAPGPEAAQPVVDPAAPTPLDDLRTAVAAGVRADALTAYEALGRRNRRTLRTDPVLRPLVQLVAGPEGEAILEAVGPARDELLRIAAIVYAADAAALGRALRAAGITSSRRLAERVGSIAAHAVFHTSAILQPILADANVRGHGACLASRALVPILRTAFAGQHPFQVLTALDSRRTITGFKAHLDAQDWLEADLGELATQIEGWETVPDWLNAALNVGKPALIQQLFNTNPATWRPLLVAAFARPSGPVRATFVPTNAIAKALIDDIGNADAAQGVASAEGLGWTPVQILEQSIAGAPPWFGQAVLDAAMPRNAEAQAIIANNNTVFTAVAAIPLHPTLAFPQLLADSERAGQVFRTNAVFQAAMLATMATFDAYLATVRGLGPWVEGLLAANRIADILRLAQADPARWKAGVDASPGGIDSIVAAVPAAGPANNVGYQGLWAVFGAPSRRSLAQCLALYEKLAPGVTLLPAGDLSVRLAHPSGTLTDPAGTGNQWKFRRQLIGMAPTLAAMSQLLHGLSLMPQSAVRQTRRLIFVNQYELEWWQQAPAAGVSANWHPFSTPQMRDIGTSMAGGGINIMRCDGRGGPIADIMGHTSDGAGVAFGGGATVDRRRDRLSVFENHAVHEFGHNVGQASFPRPSGGAPLNGNADVTTWANWQLDNAANVKADYWNPGVASVNWSVPNPMGGGNVNVAIAADDVFTYLQTAMYTNNLPGAGNDVWDNTTSWADAWTRIKGTREFKSTDMYKYMKACGGTNFNQDMCFQFPGFTSPTGSMHIYSTRWNGGRGASYDKSKFDLLRRPVGWYSLSSPNEMFAEIYTQHYLGNATPDAYWQTWFSELDQSPAATAMAGAGNSPMGGASAAAGGAQTEPGAALMRTIW